MHVTTVSGEVTLRLPAEADAQVNLHSLSGDVPERIRGAETILSAGVS